MTQPDDETLDQDEHSEQLVCPLPALPKTASSSWDKFEKWPVLDDLRKGLGDLGGLGDMSDEDDQDDELDLDLDLQDDELDLDLDEEVVSGASVDPVLTAPLLDLDGFDFEEPDELKAGENLSVVSTEQQAITTRTSTRFRSFAPSHVPEKSIDPMSKESQDLPPEH